MKLFYILLWTCPSPQKYIFPQYVLFNSSSSAYHGVKSEDYKNCDWEIYIASGTRLDGSKR